MGSQTNKLQKRVRRKRFMDRKKAAVLVAIKEKANK